MRAPRILIALPHENKRRSLSECLVKWGYQITTASDGISAWDIIENNGIWLVIASVSLSGIDGLELTRRIRAAGFKSYLYVVLITSQEKEADLLQAMEAGADEFVLEPFGPEEIRARILVAERIRQLEESLELRHKELWEANQRLSKAQDVITRDLEAAAHIQQGLLPVSTNNLYGYSFESLFIPCNVVGGDMFNFFPVDSRHLAFYLLDVSGHGIPAAMLSVAVSKTISSLPFHENLIRGGTSDLPGHEMTSPASVVRELDQLFQTNALMEQYFTMIYGVLDKETGEACFTQAGHPHPAYVPHLGEPKLVGAGGLPVGLVENADFTETNQVLYENDRLFLYSDGIVECSNQEGERFGTDGLLGFLTFNRDLPLNMLMRRLGEEIYRFHGSDNFEDDMSVLVIQRNSS